MTKNYLSNYYKQQAKIYDLTRWTFLFGRKSLCKSLVKTLPLNSKVLEIGSGTGYLLKRLSKRSDFDLNGIDLSKEMIERCRIKNLKLRIEDYNKESYEENEFDCIVLSYIFTLKENDFEQLIETIKYHLKPGGYIAVVDFHEARPLYNSFMKSQNIHIHNSLFEDLKSNFSPINFSIKRAYLGTWKWFEFIGINS